MDDETAENVVRDLSRWGDTQMPAVSARECLERFIDSSGQNDGIAIVLLMNDVWDSVAEARDLLEWVDLHPQE